MSSPSKPDGKQTLRDHLQAGYNYAYALSHHPQDAEDLVQQASCKILKRYGKINRRSVLFVAIRNLYIDKHCRNSSPSTMGDDIHELQSEVVPVER